MVSDRYDLVIDGYNLMHEAGHTRRRYGAGELERSRERFLGWLWRRIPSPLRERTVVVFDAGGTTNQYVESTTFRGFRLLFSPQDVEADDVIEDLIAAHSAPKNLQVVSSDHRLHRAARKRKSACIDSGAFIIALARMRREVQTERRRREELSKPSADPPGVIAQWLRIFQDAQQLADQESLTVAAPMERPDDPPVDSPAEDQPQRSTLVDDADTGRDLEDSSGPEQARMKEQPPDELTFWEQRVRDLLPPRAD